MAVLRFLSLWVAPLYDAIFCPAISFKLRLALLALQPLTVLTYATKWIPHVFSSNYTVEWIPVRRRPGQHLRVLVFRPPTASAAIPMVKPQLHLDIHGGAFIGGIPEYDIPFCTQLADRTGAVVISISYRHAPRHKFPAAHEDVEDAAEYMLENAERRWGADPTHLTLSGFSVGGNLALTIAQRLGRGIATGIVTFYTPLCKVDFRLPPWDKQKPADFPKRDPLFFLMPLFDAYAKPARAKNLQNSFLNPATAHRSSLPEHMMLIVPTRDILLHEQTEFLIRLNEEGDKMGDRRVEALFVENQLHGWDQLPSFAIDGKTRSQAYEAAISFVARVHQDTQHSRN